MSEPPISEFRLRRRVQFHETDMAGLVHFSRYFLYMEEAEHALWRAAGLSIHPKGSELGWPRVHTSFEFHRALRFEEEFEIRIRIVGIDEGGIRYRCVIWREETKIASGSLGIACATRRPNEPIRGTAIPEEIRARFSVAPEEPEA